jgi:hypothetical protein
MKGVEESGGILPSCIILTFRLEGLEKYILCITENSQSSVRDLNSETPEYKA